MVSLDIDNNQNLIKGAGLSRRQATPQAVDEPLLTLWPKSRSARNEVVNQQQPSMNCKD